VDTFRLSPHFTFHEATGSRDHPQLVKANRREALGLPGVLPRLVLLAGILEEIRAELGGKPVEVHSWYRGPSLNAAVGGASTSQHMAGEAVDFSPWGPDTYETIEAAYVRVLSLFHRRRVMFGQLIVEHGRGFADHWLHLSLGHPLRPLHGSREVLRYVAGNQPPYDYRGALDRSPWEL